MSYVVQESDRFFKRLLGGKGIGYFLPKGGAAETDYVQVPGANLSNPTSHLFCLVELTTE